MSKEAADVLERLGKLVDTIDNYLVYIDPGLAFTTAMRLDALKHGLEEARVVVMQVYTDLGGENVWPDASP